MVGLNILLAYYSYYIHLVHAVAWIKHTVCGLYWHVYHQGIAAQTRSGCFSETRPLSPHELVRSRPTLVHLAQRLVFVKVHDHLTMNNSLLGHDFKGDDDWHVMVALAQFCHFVNTEVCLHVGGQ